MATPLGYQDLLTLAKQNGFSGMSALIIAAIAMAESTGNTQAYNQNTNGTIDRGVLQINSYWHSEVTDACAYDASCSFQQAYRISGGGQDFSQWETFKNKKYMQYLNGAATPSTSSPNWFGSGFPTSSIDPLKPLKDLVGGITSSQAWQWLTSPNRVLKMIVGIVLVAIAVAMLFSGGSTVTDAVSTAKDVLS